MRRVIKTGNQTRKRGFTRTRRANDGDQLTRIDYQIDIIQNNPGLGIIAETDVLQLDLFRNRRKIQRISFFYNSRPSIENFINAVIGSQRLLGDGVNVPIA